MLLSLAQRLWRLLPTDGRRALFRAFRTCLHIVGQVGQILLLAQPQTRTKPGSSGVCFIVGLFDTPCGLGRAAYLNALALQQAGYRVELFDWRPSPRRLVHWRTLPAPQPSDEVDLVIIHLNPPDASRALNMFQRSHRSTQRRIAFWVWETSYAPWIWRLHALAFDEVWAPSAFAAQSLRGVARPLRVVPHPCALVCQQAGEGRLSARLKLGLPSDTFVTGFAFDMRSGFERKNPLGLIEAFTRAFPDPGPARLVIRVSGRQFASDLWRRLEDATERTPSIVLLDEDASMESLYSACDVYASLHRCEGYGLTLAEAMLRGLPVVATGWSGNLEFMTCATSVLVPFRLVRVRDPQRLYGGKSLWAEPDLDMAATALIALAGDPDLRANLGRLARNTLAEQLGRLEGFAAADPRPSRTHRYASRPECSPKSSLTCQAGAVGA